MQIPSIVVHGPMGCGKTRHATALAARFGVEDVIDNWDGRSHVPQYGALVLTNRTPADLPRHHGLRVMAFDQALSLLSDGADEALVFLSAETQPVIAAA